MITINLSENLKNLVIEKIADLGHNTNLNEDLDTLLMTYLNLKNKIPPIRKWTVKKSKEIQYKTLTEDISFYGRRIYVKWNKYKKSNAK